MYELKEWLRGKRHVTLKFQCLPHCMQSALFPVIQQLQHLAELVNEDTETIRLQKIEKLLSRGMDQPQRALPFIAEMMSIPMRFQEAFHGLMPQQVKARTLQCLAELLRGLARKIPVCCVLEDSHWIDPSTQELLELVLGQIEKERILLIVTHRPEYQLQS